MSFALKAALGLMVERLSRHASQRTGDFAVQQIGMITFTTIKREPLVELKLFAQLGRAISWWIGDPSIKLGLFPAGAAYAKLNLLGKCAFFHFAVDSRAGQAGALENGLKADDTVWFGHGLGSID